MKLDNIKNTLSDVKIIETLNEITIKAEYKDALNVINILKHNKETQASCFIGIFGVHNPNSKNEFCLEYLFLSMKYNMRFRIIINFDANDEIDSISEIFKGAIWYEREAFDMFGIKFKNLYDPRRLLTDYNFKHHPLRKDFPVIGYEEVRYDPISQEVQYSPTNLAQEYRDFDFQTPWNTEAVFEKIKNS